MRLVAPASSPIEVKDIVLLILSILGAALLGFLIAYYFHHRQSTAKEPVWAARSAIIVEPGAAAAAGITLHFQGRAISTASITHLALWNRGQRAIEGTDLGEVSPLAIRTADKVTLLSVSVLKETDRENKVHCTHIGDEQVTIGFKYLAHDDGALFQIVHTGTSSKSVSIVGNIRESKPLRHVIPGTGVIRGSQIEVRANVSIGIVFALLVILIVVFSTGALRGNVTDIIEAGIAGAIALVGGFVYSSLFDVFRGIMYGVRARAALPIPKQLRTGLFAD